MFPDLDLPALLADRERDAAATALHSTGHRLNATAEDHHLVHQILFGTELS